MAAKPMNKSHEEIFAKFQNLRNDQRNLASKISELEIDLNEHKRVIETLKQVKEDRKCFRMIGGILCERTVKDVLPELENNREQLPKLIAALTEKLGQKGREINEYKENNNIKIRGQDDMPEEKKDATTTSGKTNVLVS